MCPLGEGAVRAAAWLKVDMATFQTMFATLTKTTRQRGGTKLKLTHWHGIQKHQAYGTVRGSIAPTPMEGLRAERRLPPPPLVSPPLASPPLVSLPGLGGSELSMASELASDESYSDSDSSTALSPSVQRHRLNR